MTLSSKELYEFITTVVEDKIKDVRVTREEFDKLREKIGTLSESVERLAEAQRRTDETVQQLVEAQRRTDERLDRLENAMERLTEAHRQLAIQVGKLSDTVGYTLEDMARTYLPPFLEKKINITMEREELVQRHFELSDGTVIEIDAWGTGVTVDGQNTQVIVSCKSRLHITDVTRFDAIVKRICDNEGISPDSVIKILFGYHIEPRVMREAEKRDMIAITPYTATKIFREW